jgi:hypothetical protein
MSSPRFTLPGDPPPALESAYFGLSEMYAKAIYPHILGGTSSEVLASWFSRAGHPVGARTIRRYRATLTDSEGSV